MHTCCAPCFTYIEDDIKNNGIINKNGENENVVLTSFLYNPNIQPKVEYERRKDTFVNFCNMKSCQYVVVDEYDLDKFVNDVVEKTGENKEYSLRCEYCYFKRLNKTFEYAKENGYNIVSTTLAISPYQNHELIKKIGNELENKYDIEFLYKDYRPNFRQGQQMAKELGLYRQKYCGCIFSIDSGKWEY